MGFSLALAAIWSLERERATHLVRGIEREEASTFTKLLNLRGASLQAFVSDYTFWDDMVRFAAAPDPEWATQNIDTALGTFGADGAWVYRTDGTPVYSVDAGESGLPALPLSPEELRALFEGRPFAQFFVDSSAGLLEVWGATIHPTRDPQRRTPPRGYFFAGRLWDGDFVAELNGLVGGTVELLPPGHPAASRSGRAERGLVAFSQDLLDWRGGVARQVHVRTVSPIIQQVDRFSRMTFLLLFVFSLIVLVVPSILLVRWINVPLGRIARSLESADPAALGRLHEAQTEFGDLARLVDRFLKQEDLVRQAKAQAERANQAKSEFLSRMSHELRTPLNAVLGFAQLLEMDSLTPDQRASVAHILKGGQHLLDLINEVLDIARIEAGRLALTVEPVPLSAVIEETLAMVGPLGQEAGIRLSHMAAIRAPVVRADRQRLTQVLLNLLANAIKYNRQGGSVTLSVDRVRDSWVRLSVTDTGPGIAPENMGRLFTPFERLGADNGTVEGSGLGLALSKRLVEAMGGEMGVESVVGQGSTFWVEVAVQPEGVVRPIVARAGR